MGRRFLIIYFCIIFFWGLSGSEIPGKQKNVKKKVVAVMGSSVAAGFVTSYQGRYDMQNGYASRLLRRLAEDGFEVKNISRPGDTTGKVLARIEQDLFSLKPDLVLIGLSLSNEGVARTPTKAFVTFQTNLEKIIKKCLQKNIKPVIGLCYPNDDFKSEQYELTKRINLIINQWEVPSINFFGVLDNGYGNFVKGIPFDQNHPGNRGHEEMFLSIPPGLFQSLLNNSVQTEQYNHGEGTVFFKGQSGCYIPKDPVHSFSLVVDIKVENRGIPLRVVGLESDLELHLDSGISLNKSGKKMIENRSRGKEWLKVFITFHYLKKELRMYSDGKLLGSVSGDFQPLQFVFGNIQNKTDKINLRNLFIYRSVINESEVKWISQGNFYKSSLEFFSPLNQTGMRGGEKIKNQAWNNVDGLWNPKDTSHVLARLKSRINRYRLNRKNEYIPIVKQPVLLSPEKLDRYTGRYQIAPGDFFEVKKEGEKLYFMDGREKSELLYEKDDCFFIHTYIDLTVIFKSDDQGIFALDFKIGRGGKTVRVIHAKKKER